MGFYQDEIVPILINLTMRRRDLATYRGRVVPSADGRVLEIGIGSGLNLPFYSRNVKDLIGLEPSPKLLSMVRRNLGSDTRALMCRWSGGATRHIASMRFVRSNFRSLQ